MDAPRGASGHGVVGYLTKPAKREALVEVIQKLIRSDAANEARVLIVEDDPETSQSVAELLGQSDVRVRQACTADEAVHALQTERFSCVILDLGLPDLDGLRFLEDLQARKDLSLPPVVVHTGRALSREETRRLHDYAQAVVLKDGRSAERLVDEVRLFVGQLRDRLPRNVIGKEEVALTRDLSLGGAKVLIADDDMRTVYALSALLRGKGAEVVVADTGREALRVLDQQPNVQLVLMDIMMPDMDGYETMRHLRAEPRFMDLPVIALTAKAMKGENERCQAAGASDYMAKPVDPAALLLCIKRWLVADAPS
jgi:CheY-like chemotaxis protein